MALEFQNDEVKKAYDINTELEKDFQVRVPQLKWYGMFSQITPEVAAQLVKEGYNHLKLKSKK